LFWPPLYPPYTSLYNHATQRARLLQGPRPPRSAPGGGLHRRLFVLCLLRFKTKSAL
jgi:hypothetical protein